MPTEDPYRLPRSVLPSRYDLELVVDPDRPTFSGRVAIEVEVVEPTDRILLNSLDLTLGTVTVTADGGAAQEPAVELDVEHERAALVLDHAVPAGRARIEADFVGPYCEALVGLYRSTFSIDGEEHHLAVTQFESTYARRAFPCFDEPDMKAVFAVTLVVPEGLVAVSNAAEVGRESLGDGTVRVRFADTMAMSTYLVAAVVGPLEVTEPRPVQGMSATIPLRVVHPPGSGPLATFALDVADAGIRFLEGYYDLPYPGDKVDLVAVPDFAFGAMENLGCITFREVALLVDPDDSTQPELQRVADVINHELAHMWFGDLVTMGWWNGIWLNEAFATFMEVTASDAFRPDWDTWTGFGLSRAAAFDTDALSTTRPIEFDVRSPADAEAMFDILTYEKGASVVRMLEQYLGAERFRDGIRHYLRTHAYGNTETTDLWDALEEVTGEPVRHIMDAWIYRGGHPVVTAELTDHGATLRQEPATVGGPDADPGSGTGVVGDELGRRWPVPLVVTATVDGTERRERVLLEDPTTVDLGGRPTALRVNTRGDGFFRSELPSPVRAAEAVDPSTTPLERFVLLDDAWAALLRGDLTGAAVEDLVRLSAWRETDPSVWRRIAQAVRELRRLRGLDHDGDINAALAVDVADGPLAQVGRLLDELDPSGLERWQDLRGILFSLLGVVGRDAGIRTLAHELVHTPPDEARARADTDSTLLAAALDVVAATGTAQDHELIEERWHSATNPQDVIRYLYALADTPVAECFDHLLELTLTDVRSQDSAYVLRRALSHPRFADRAWDFLSTNWDAVLDKVPSSAAVRMFEGVRSVTDPDLAASIQAFTADHPTPSGARVLAQHLERMWITVRASERLRAEIGDGPAS
jgi:puromycin-sensitive aminopeptidase